MLALMQVLKVRGRVMFLAIVVVLVVQDPGVCLIQRGQTGWGSLVPD